MNKVATRYTLPHRSLNLRRTVFSQPTISRSLGRTTVRMTFLACDVLRGIYHYSAEVDFPAHPHAESLVTFSAHKEPLVPLDLKVSLLASHNGVQSVPPATTAHRVGRAWRTHKLASLPHAYISMCTLGNHGRRGVWVEKYHAGRGQSIVGFCSSDDDPRELTSAVRARTANGQSTRDNITGQCVYQAQDCSDAYGAYLYFGVSQMLRST